MCRVQVRPRARVRCGAVGEIDGVGDGGSDASSW